MRIFGRKSRREFVSMLDLDVRRRELKLTPSMDFLANLFLSEEHDRILVAPTHCIGGGAYPTRTDVRVIPFQSPVAEVGRYARDALLAMEIGIADEVLPGPVEDAVFNASGVRTLRKFGLEYKHLVLQTSGGSLLVDEAIGYSVDPLDHVRVCGTLAPACSYEALGSVILEVYHRSRYMKTCPKHRYR